MILPYSFSHGQYKSASFTGCTEGQHFLPASHLSFQGFWCGVMDCHLPNTDAGFIATGAFPS